MQSIRSINLRNMRAEVKTRLEDKGFKLIQKTSKKFWAVKAIDRKEIDFIIEDITALLSTLSLDGPDVQSVPKFSYALLNETKAGAAGISIEF